MLQWILLVGVALFAWAGWTRAGRLARKLDALNQSYWELRYEYGQLRARVTRLEPPVTEAGAAGGAGGNLPQEAARPAGNFVPLSSLKR